MLKEISSYVFFDIETTGLPFKERNRTKIIELSFVAALRKDILTSEDGAIPPVSKLTLMLNPQRKIDPEVTQLTGLSNKMLQHAPLYKDKIKSIISFLEELPKPVCLVAHNGNSFDFKILLAECADIDVYLPIDLLCVDSLVGFRKIFKDKPVFPDLNISSVSSSSETYDEWPDLNVSKEEWQEIDDLCSSLSDVSFEDLKKDNSIKKIPKKIVKQPSNKSKSPRPSFALSNLYTRLLKKEVKNAHRAEADCIMLLECVVTMKKEFLPWADGACKSLIDIQPLERK